jgi:hypothetical protein
MPILSLISFLLLIYITRKSLEKQAQMHTQILRKLNSRFALEHRYFSITTMSTAGLQGPSTDSKFSMVFTGIYVLVGVPLYVIVSLSLSLSLSLKQPLTIELFTDTRTVSDVTVSFSSRTHRNENLQKQWRRSFHFMNLSFYKS